jgi:hypothetical protein
MSYDKLNLQFSWTLAQGYSWFKLYALFFTGCIARGLAKSGPQHRRACPRSPRHRSP